MATVTLTQTESPSRSKMAGPCWIAIGDVYASTAGREISAEVGATLIVKAKVTLRRVTRTTTDRASWSVFVTGDPADTVTVSLGTPQRVSALIGGVREVAS